MTLLVVLLLLLVAWPWEKRVKRDIASGGECKGWDREFNSFGPTCLVISFSGSYTLRLLILTMSRCTRKYVVV